MGSGFGVKSKILKIELKALHMNANLRCITKLSCVCFVCVLCVYLLIIHVFFLHLCIPQSSLTTISSMNHYDSLSYPSPDFALPPSFSVALCFSSIICLLVSVFFLSFYLASPYPSMSETNQYLFFSFWLISASMISSNFIHVAAKDKFLFDC